MFAPPSKVQSVIMDMGLRNNADQRVGGSVVRGVSGGEKRRITIGIQLLKDPGVCGGERECVCVCLYVCV